MLKIIDVKNCPFCGGRARVVTKYLMVDKRYISVVKCTKCKANSGSYATEYQAIRYWNKRYSRRSFL